MSTLSDHIPQAVFSRWAGFAGKAASRITAGLINQTFAVGDDTGCIAVIQRLHPLFEGAVNLDIEAITSHLAAKGLVTPRLIPTDQDALWVEHGGHVWRALSWVAGRNYNKIHDPSLAREAGMIVARFHRALADLSHNYRSTRRNVHDTPAHLERLVAAIDTHRGHPLRSQVQATADPLLESAVGLTDLSALPARHAHGDLKISNLLFDGASRGGGCLVDLDTLSRMIWPLEMGDALRSWCNPREEHQRPVSLNLELLEAAVAGYTAVASDLIPLEEWQLLIAGLAQICLELSARFLTDSLNEEYFGWDPTRYPSRGAHNLVRGLAMWELYQDVQRQRHAAEAIVTRYAT